MQFLLAEWTSLLLAEPLLDAIDVEQMVAGQAIDFFLGVYVAVADGAQLSLHCLASQPLQLLELFRRDAFRDTSHLFFQLQQFLIGHIVGVDLKAVLVSHGEDHLAQVLQVDGPHGFIWMAK